MVYSDSMLTVNDVDRVVPKIKSVHMPTFVETLMMVERGTLDEFLYARELDIRYKLI